MSELFKQKNDNEKGFNSYFEMKSLLMKNLYCISRLNVKLKSLPLERRELLGMEKTQT